MSVNKEIAQQLADIFNARDPEGLAELVTDQVTHTAAGTAFGAQLKGRDAYISHMRAVLASFKDVKFDFYNLLEDRERNVVVAEWKGDFVTAAGRSFSSQGAFVLELEDGKINWVREYFDTEKTKQAMS